MAVAVDATTTATAGGSSVTTLALTTLTVGSGSNRALLAFIAIGAASTAMTVTWDVVGANQAMALIGTATLVGTVKFQVWGLVNPASGNKTLTASWTNAASLSMDAMSFTGVDQTGGTTSFPNFNTATAISTTPSVAITSNVGDYVVATGCTTGVTINSMNNTTLHIDGAHFGFGSNYATGSAGSTTMSAVLASSIDWSIIGVDIAAPALTLNQKSLVMM